MAGRSAGLDCSGSVFNLCSCSRIRMAAQHDYLSRVERGVYVLDPRLGPDTMAVLGAMASRAPDLAKKIDRTFEQILAEEGRTEWDYENPPERIVSFIRENVQGYGHASIASMAKAVWMLLEGFGWPMAWLLEDTPLFDGQEISTRAVDATRIAGADGPGTLARLAPRELADLHLRWIQVYDQVKAEAKGGGWKYDDARVYLPGTVPTGVVFTQDVRAIARQLDHIRALGGACGELADMGYAALGRVSPVMAESIGGKRRRPLQNWRYDVEAVRAADYARPESGVEVWAWDDADGEARKARWLELAEQIEPRTRPSTYLDPLWKLAPRFEVRIPCSVAVARDWHRHRPVMPWRLAVHTDQDTGHLLLAPWYAMEARLPEGLLRDTTDAFLQLRASASAEALEAPARLPHPAEIAALHALPFGALVTLTCVGTLPDLLYMLEMRATSEGASPEYRAQARAALGRMCALIPREVLEAEQLDGVLRQNVGAHPI
jgi:hypothetical protein